MRILVFLVTITLLFFFSFSLAQAEPDDPIAEREYAMRTLSNCGGNNQLPCSTIRPYQEACPEGSYWTPGISISSGGNCWRCPTGYKKTLLASHGPKACKKIGSNKYSEPEKVKYSRCSISKKACWRCYFPYKRTLRKADHDKACVMRKIYRCDSEHYYHAGKCYKKPPDVTPGCGGLNQARCRDVKVYKRCDAGLALRKGKCVKRIDITPDCGGHTQAPCTFTSATLVKSTKCDAGTFKDPRKGGECWKCPSGYKRTVLKVTGKKACKRTRSKQFSRATFVKTLKCDSGSFRDIRSGGCWSCPSGFVRSANINHKIESNNACEVGVQFTCDAGFSLHYLKRTPTILGLVRVCLPVHRNSKEHY